MRIFALCLLLSMMAVGCSSTGSCCSERAPMLRHVVLFKFKADTTPEKLKAIEAKFAWMQGQIKEIKAFEWGTNNSPEGLAQEFTHCFLVTFENGAGRDAYLIHPAHKEFVDLAKPSIEKVLVVDYDAK